MKLSDITSDQVENPISTGDSSGNTGTLKLFQVTQPVISQTTEPVSRTGRIVKGLAKDPLDALTQLVYNALPESVRNTGDQINNVLAKTGAVSEIPPGGFNQLIGDQEKTYQQSRGDQAGTFDAYRLGGNIAPIVAATVLSRGQAAPATVPLLGRVLAGAAQGAGYSLLQPVTDNPQSSSDFFNEKGKQALIGAAGGGLAPPLVAGAARVVNPIVNPAVKALQAEGVQPTVGQALGKIPSAIEEKAQSIPIMGDMIARARNQTFESFNNAAINRAVSPIGQKVEGSGFEAIKEAGDKLSSVYDSALNQIKGVRFDAKFDMDLAQLKQMSQNLTPDLSRRFDKTLNDIVTNRISPARSMLPETYKAVDSELSNIATRYGKSSVASEQEFGDAVSQLQNLLNQQMKRSNPQVAGILDKADEGWAHLVRVEQAAKSAKNSSGVFSPAQLNAAIQSADDSVRGRAVSRGTALMQNLSSNAQSVIGSKVPDSGTATRLMLGSGALASGAISPAIPIGLAVGGSLYTRPIQNAMVSALTKRPDIAGPISNYLRLASPYAPAIGAPVSNAFLQR